jgi:alpha-L-rhamnosidase
MDSDHGALALQLLTATHENSWSHMIEVGATATMEAWSRREKPNLSWSHPWATAPSSAVAWGLFGIQPLAPAFQTFMCKIQPGALAQGSIKVPTLRGTIEASFTSTATAFTVHLSPPPNTLATVCLPKLALPGTTLELDGQHVSGYVERDYVCIDKVGSNGTPRVIVRA